jgi:hypothetical protein
MSKFRRGSDEDSAEQTLPAAGVRSQASAMRSVSSSSYELISKAYPNVLEVERFGAVPQSRRNQLWQRHRADIPETERIAPELAMDLVHYRAPSERAYCQALAKLIVPFDIPATPSVSLVGLPTPFIPFVWQDCSPCESRCHPSQSITGDLSGVSNTEPAADSAQALWAGSLGAGTGDPGQRLHDIRKEGRIFQQFRYLVPWGNVEFYSTPAEPRSRLYARAPTWWEADGWTSPQMFVPLPPCLAYRGSQLIGRDRYAGRETRFWWRVFESEWVALVFSRWCTDIVQRRIMWHLPQRALQGIRAMRVEALLCDSPYCLGDVRAWLTAHDEYSWSARRMYRCIREATPRHPAWRGIVEEFVRRFPPPGDRSPERPQSERVTNTAGWFDYRGRYPSFVPTPSVILPTVTASPKGSVDLGEMAGTSDVRRDLNPASPSSPESPQWDEIHIQATPERTGSQGPREPRSDTVRPSSPSNPGGPAPSVESGPTGGEQGDPRLPGPLIDRLRKAKLVDLVQEFAATEYQCSPGELQPLTEQVLVCALRSLRDSYLELEECARRERVARMQMEQRLVNTEDLLSRERVDRDVERRRERQLRQDLEATLPDRQGVKRPWVP